MQRICSINVEQNNPLPKRLPFSDEKLMLAEQNVASSAWGRITRRVVIRLYSVVGIKLGAVMSFPVEPLAISSPPINTLVQLLIVCARPDNVACCSSKTTAMLD